MNKAPNTMKLILVSSVDIPSWKRLILELTLIYTEIVMSVPVLSLNVENLKKKSS